MNTDRLQKLKEMERQEPDEPFFKYAMGLEYVSAELDNEAKACFKEVADKFPLYVAVYLHLGQLYERANDYENCIAVYRKGVEVATQLNDKKAARELNEALLLTANE